MKTYSKPMIEVVRLSEDLLQLIVSSKTVDQGDPTPGSGSGSLAKPNVIEGGHFGGNSNYWDD